MDQSFIDTMKELFLTANCFKKANNVMEKCFSNNIRKFGAEHE